MIKEIKQLYWKYLSERNRRSSASDKATYRYAFAKNNTNSVFGQLQELMKSNSIGIPNETRTTISKVQKKMLDQLKDSNYQTHFRHKEVEMNGAKCAEGVSSPAEGAALLFTTIRVYKPKLALEIGSAFGVGSMYVTSAITLNKTGQMDGIEHEKWRCDIANSNVESIAKNTAKIYCGKAEEIVPQLIKQRRDENKKYDFVFVDAVHKYDDTMGYHKMLVNELADGAIVIYDDINWSEEMKRFWDDVVRDDNISDAMLVNDRYGFLRYNSPTQ